MNLAWQGRIKILGKWEILQQSWRLLEQNMLEQNIFEEIWFMSSSIPLWNGSQVRLSLTGVGRVPNDILATCLAMSTHDKD